MDPHEVLAEGATSSLPLETAVPPLADELQRRLADDLRDIVWRRRVQQQLHSLRIKRTENDTKSGDRNFSRIQKFLNRLRRLTDGDKSSLITEANSLNVSMFLSEVAEAIAEVNIKPTAIRSLVEITVVIASQYDDFPFLLSKALETQVRVGRTGAMNYALFHAGFWIRKVCF